MVANYKAGQQVALAGIPKAKLEFIATSYVYQNLANVGATAENYKEMLAISSRVTGSSRILQMRHVEELRAAELKGKTAPQSAQINKSYDLALAYYGMCEELTEAQAAGGTEPFKFPHLSSRISSSYAGEGAYSYAGEGAYVPAGAWRAQADEALAARKKEQQAAALSATAPIDAAIQELPAGKQAAVRSLIVKVKKDALANGVTGSDNLLTNMSQAISAHDDWHWTVDDSTADTALKVVARAKAIAAERGNPDVFLKGSVLKEQKVVAAAAKAKAGTLDIAGKSVGEIINLARGEITGEIDADNKTAAAIVNQYSATIADVKKFAQVFVNLNQASVDNPDNAGVGLALAQLVRARDIYYCQQKGLKTIQALGNNDTMNPQAYIQRVGGAWFKAFADQGFAPNGDFALPDAAQIAAAGAGAGGGATVSKGAIKLWPRKDGTPAPNPDEVPALMDEAQVRALQEKLSVKVDGMYGAETHAAALAAAEKQNKKLNECDFTLEGALDAFCNAIAGLVGGADAPAEGASAGAEADPAAALKAVVAKLGDVSGADLDARTTKECKAKLAELGFTPPAAILAKGIKDNCTKTIGEQLSAAGVDADTVRGITASIAVDANTGFISSSFLGKLEKFVGFADANSVYDARDAALLSDPTAIGLIAGAIKSGQLTV